MKQLLILSGKGGTGKTTVASAFIKLGEIKAFADCDVDAPNLHLVMNQSTKPQCSDYYGMPIAEIDKSLCIQCDTCREHCRFDAISVDEDGYSVDPFSCEGCGVCEAMCPSGAISLKPSVAGKMELFSGETVFSTAQLKMGSGTSGKLVTEVKKHMVDAAPKTDVAIIDGSPGIGCPVIASLSGVHMVLIVAEPSISGISDMERIVKTARIFDVKVLVCINKFDTNLEQTELIKKYCKAEKINFVGLIPFDTEAVTAINQGKSVVDVDCAAGSAVKAVFEKTISLLMKES